MVYVLGFISQVLFFTRTLLQWIQSERAQKVVSPTIYWILSIVASYLFCIYGWFRNDFSILLGQMMAYYIYIWNLNETGIWKKIHTGLRAMLIFTPLCAIGWVLKNGHYFVANFLSNTNIPLWLVLFGASGQIVFSIRFVYQWLYSMHKNESLLPMGFWLISLTGSTIIVMYGLIRVDPILIMGQSVGVVAYTRNIVLNRNEIRKAAHAN